MSLSSLRGVVDFLLPGQQFVVCVPTHEYAARIRPSLLGALSSVSKVLIVTHRSRPYLDVSKETYRTVELAPVGSPLKAVSTVKHALTRMPKKGLVVVDATDPEQQGETLEKLLRTLRRSSHRAIWIVSRDAVSSQQISSLKDDLPFFLDLTVIGSVAIAQFLTARGVYEPEWFLPRPLVMSEHDVLFAKATLPVLVPLPGSEAGAADTTPAMKDLFEQKYRQVFETSREGMMMLDEATGYREVNDRLCEIVGYDQDELRRLKLTSLVSPGFTWSLRRAVVQARRKGRVVCDLRVARKSGRTVDVRVYASRLPDATYLAIVHDITDEKRSEAHLRRREAEFRAIVDSDPIPRAVFVNRKLVFRNSAFDKAFSWLSIQQRQDVLLHRLLGKKNNSLVKSIAALAGSPDRQEIRKTRTAIASEGGRQVWFEISARPITYGARSGVQCSFLDVTDEVESLRQLASSKETFRNLVEHSDEALSVDDGEEFVFVNRKFLDLCQFGSPEDIVGKSLATLRTKRRRKPRGEEIRQTPEGLHEREVFQETLKRGDGSTVEVETERVATTFDSKRLFLTYRRDVSVRRRAELETNQRINALEYLRKNSASIHQTLDMPELIRIGLVAAKEMAECEAGAVLAVAADGTGVEVVLQENLSDAVATTLSQMTVHEGLTGLAVKTQEPVLLTLEEYPPHLPYRSLFESEGFHSVAVLPVANDGRPLAVMLLASRERRIWDDEDQLLLSSLARELGVAYANAQRFGRVTEREEMYGSTINRARDILYRCTPGGSFVFIGSGIQRLVGYTPEEFIRSAALLRDLVHPDDRTVFSQRISHQAKNVDEFTLEYRVLPRGKATYRWVRDAVSFERGASGEVLSFTGLLSDISESRNLQDGLLKSEQLKANILNSIQEGVVVFDADLRYIDWNRSMESMTGLPRDAVLGRRLGEGMPTLTSEGVVHQLQRALRGEAVISDEMPFILPAGEAERFFWSQYAPLQDRAGTIRGVVGIVTDVSKRRQLEREVRESEETLRNVIDTMGDALMISDLQGRVWEVNREFTRLTGFARKEALGMDFPYPWVLEEDMAKFVEWITALRERNYLRDFDMTWKAKDGRLVAISMNTSLLRNALGEPVAMLNIARDISERRHLTQQLERKVRENVELYAQVEAQVRRLTSLYELGKSLTGTLDARTLLDNVRAEVAKAVPIHSFAYYVLSPDRLSLIPVYMVKDGERFYEKNGDRSRSIILDAGSILRDVVTNETPYLGASPDGFPAHESLLAVPMKSRETVVGMLCLTSTDPDAFSESHLRLFESIATLTEIALEKATLYEDTVKKAREIEERNKELDDFTYVVSHDLKEPLITIEGYSKILLKDYQNVIDQEGSEYLQTVVQSSDHMKGLIDDLLTLSRLGHVREATEVVSAREVIMEVLQDIQFTLHERNTAVQVSENLPEVRYNRTQLLIVFRNLITNAVKFNDKPQPTVDITASEEGQEYVFSVKDNGIGIDERYFDRIFMIFQRLQRKEEYQGTGAGLTIVKKIVENHHGRVWVNSALNEGTTIFFTVPK